VKKVNEDEKVTVFLTTHYMDEADRVAHRIGVIDHGKLVAQGTPKAIKEETGTESLEEAFLKLTGSTIRDEGADSADAMRQFAKMWSGAKR
jgi:ABC-2 type transport system ATP-binding protein